MNDVWSVVVVQLDQQLYALKLEAVARVLPAIWITPLPGSPEVIMGITNIRGQVIPVLDMRRRCGLPARDLLPSDQLVMVHAASRDWLLPVDAVTGTAVYPCSQVVVSPELTRGECALSGVIVLSDGLMLIHDLETFLDADDLLVLDHALDTLYET
ncbi:chemotaxis protein CheW [Chitinivorax sp. B]|uniref:chemotaxis protein CheW n=1 Tax=Chitinivorax sp. B TaxID=2502235 RepID=UPI0010FA607E|nr:chemotaxis protein CheW [Chitinivorax sp. B]